LVIIPGERAEITGIFRRFDTKNTAAPWEYDGIFQDRINNAIGEIEVLSIEKTAKNPIAVNLHNYIRQKFANTRYNSLYVSLFLGDRSFVTQDIKSFFKESGLFHFLSVSGMHIAILIIAFSLIVRILPLPFLIRKTIVSVLILALPFIVGFNPATLRAVIMGIIVVVSPIFNRKNNALNSLFTSAFLILAFYPMHIFLIGFQFSFIATFGILILPKILENIKYKKTVLIITLPIFLFLLTMPIQIYHFGTINFASLFCNIFILPILEIVCNAALLSLFIPFETISQFLLFLCDKTLDLTFWLINKFIIFTGFGEQYTNISPLWFIAIILVIFTCSSFKKHRIIYSFFALMFLITALLIFQIFKKDTIYTISSQNFRMKLLSGKNSTAVILGGAQTKLYYNPQFLRWLKTNLSGGTIITDESYIPSDFLRQYTHIIMKNTTGEIKFECENERYKTEKILPEEKKQRKIGIEKKFYKTIIR
jgi:ComEC/Rec2-related protein